MSISQANRNDLDALARLIWLDTKGDDPAGDLFDMFTVELAEWWDLHQHSHFPFVARLADVGIVGMAWVAIVPRVPRPGSVSRRAADIQTVFVMAEHRGRGLGSALVSAAVDHATRLGAVRVTVHSGRRAVPVYERLGFASSKQLLQRPED